MSTKDILRKAHVDQAEMIHVVQDYILARKGLSVDIELETRNLFKANVECHLLNVAFIAACEWFAHNPQHIPS